MQRRLNGRCARSRQARRLKLVIRPPTCWTVWRQGEGRVAPAASARVRWSAVPTRSRGPTARLPCCGPRGTVRRIVMQPAHALRLRSHVSSLIQNCWIATAAVLTVRREHLPAVPLDHPLGRATLPLHRPPSLACRAPESASMDTDRGVEDEFRRSQTMTARCRVRTRAAVRGRRAAAIGVRAIARGGSARGNEYGMDL